MTNQPDNPNLPDDWTECRLDQMSKIVSGKSQKGVESPNGKYPIYGSGGSFGHATEYICEPGTTVIGRKGTINSPIFVNEKFWNVDTAFGISSLSANLNAKFLYFFCKGFNFTKLDKSTTIPSLAKRDIAAIPIPLAPLPEQRAIVARIEQLFSELDNGIANLKTARAKLDIYRQAVLKKAFEGELTSPSCNKNSETNLPCGWERLKIGEVAIVGTGATPRRGNTEYWDGGTIPWVTSGALNNSFVTKETECITEKALRETNCKVASPGTLLVAMYGEGKTRGKCSELKISAATNQAIATVELKEKYASSKSYLKWFLTKNYEDIRLLSNGGVQPNLNLSIVKSTLVPFPGSVVEQHQIVQEIESRLSVCDKLAETIDTGLKQAESLRQSILRKAFTGQLLTPEERNACRQEPDWCPAGELVGKEKDKKT